MTKAQMKQRVLKIVERKLYHERNGNAKGAQREYDKLYNFCLEHNINFGDALKGATAQISKSLAGIMNGLGAN